MVVEHVVCGPEELLIFMMFGHELLTASVVESAGLGISSDLALNFVRFGKGARSVGRDLFDLARDLVRLDQ